MFMNLIFVMDIGFLALFSYYGCFGKGLLKRIRTISRHVINLFSNEQQVLWKLLGSSCFVAFLGG